MDFHETYPKKDWTHAEVILILYFIVLFNILRNNFKSFIKVLFPIFTN